MPVLLFVALALADAPLVFEPVPVQAPPPKPDLIIVPDRLPAGDQVSKQIDAALTEELQKKAEAATAPR